MTVTATITREIIRNTKPLKEESVAMNVVPDKEVGNVAVLLAPLLGLVLAHLGFACCRCCVANGGWSRSREREREI
jgi:hypothetical protein